MSLSLELIRQRNENVVRSLTRAAGRHPQWWFAKLMRLGVSQSPSALTGNRLAAIYSVTLDEPNPVRVTVQPQEHVHFLLDLLGNVQHSVMRRGIRSPHYIDACKRLVWIATLVLALLWLQIKMKQEFT